MTREVKFSFEVPIDHLEDFHEDQDFLFTLSILYGRQTYRRYVKDCTSRTNLTLWIDNSYNETREADNPERLAALYKEFKADYLISPDSPRWPVERLRSSYLKMCELVPEGSLVLVVPDHRTYQALSDQLCPGRYAISYWVRRSWYPDEVQSVPNLHFLGLLSPEELRAAKPASCDTSIPVKLAMQGMTLNEWVDSRCPHIHSADLGLHGHGFFQAHLARKQLQLAKDNIKQLKEMVNG